MAKYVVVLEGKNLWIEFDEEVSIHGGFTNRVLEAASAEEAARMAVQQMHSKHPVHKDVLNPPDDPPVFVASEIHSLSRWSRRKDSGLIYFEEADQEGRIEALSMAREIAGIKPKQ